MKDKEKSALIFGRAQILKALPAHLPARTILTHMDFVQNCRAQCFCFIHRYDESTICESNDYSNYLLLSYDQYEWPWTKDHAIHSILR